MDSERNLTTNDFFILLLDEKSLAQNTTSSAPEFSPLVTDTTAFWFKVLVYVSLSAAVSIFGMATNIINIVIFVRQGVFSDSASTSLLCLAVSDLLCVASMLLVSVSMAMVIAEPQGLPWNPWDIMYLVAGTPHLMFAQITRMVTAYVAFERCFCVVFPFKVKTFFTPKRTMIIFACIFVFVCSLYAPMFITQQLKLRFDPTTNVTRLVLVLAPNWQLVVDTMVYINSFIFNNGSVVMVMICTMVTVSRVNLSKDWRESMTSGAAQSSDKPQAHKNDPKEKQLSTSKMQKEKKLVRMITSISIIFLICYIPDLIYLISFRVDNNIRIGKRYENLTMVMYSFTFLFESIGSSINILVYYKMSAKYKEDFNNLFGLK